MPARRCSVERALQPRSSVRYIRTSQRRTDVRAGPVARSHPNPRGPLAPARGQRAPFYPENQTMAWSLIRCAATALAGGVLLACHPVPSNTQQMPVPARAPSTAPRSLWSRDNWYRDTVFVSGTYLRDIAVVLFKATA